MIQGLSPELEHILEAGNSAPSGENCQPWRFIVRDGGVEIHLLPERDQSAYSWGQRASYLACGAVIENMIIAASGQQCRGDVTYFPNAQNAWHIATIRLTKDPAVQPDPLATHIDKRISNRKPYHKEPLASEDRDALITAAAQYRHGTFTLTESPNDIKSLGRVGATNEEVMLANRMLHRFFFSHVTWTKTEDEKQRIGFYIETLELPPPARVLFRLFRRWFIMRTLAAIGFNRAVAGQNASTNASAAAMGAFITNDTAPLDFVHIGRTIERVWLVATSLGLSLQPLTGVLFFKLKIDGGESEAFSPHQQKIITDAYNTAAHIFNAGDRRIVFMFRIGHGDPPSAHAIRFPLDEVVTIA